MRSGRKGVAAPQTGVQSLAPSLQILIVEDDPDVAAVLREYLARAHRVELAGTVAEALATAARVRPDLVLLDLNLPGASGLEALDELRAINPKVAVILVTGTPDLAPVAEALRAGILAYLPKPFNLDYLGHLVAVVLGTHQRPAPPGTGRV